MKDISAVGVKDIIDSLSEGVYVCDLDRTITYWSRSAQRITGWEEAERKRKLKNKNQISIS